MSTRRASRLMVLSVGVVFAIVALVAGCSQAAPAPSPAKPASQAASAPAAAKPESKPAETKTSVLKINMVSASDAPQTKAVRDMAAEIKQKSNGTFDVQVYANSELGSNADNVEQAARGTAIMTFADTGYVASWVPDFMAMTLPYLYRDYKGVSKVIASPWYADMVKAAGDKGLKMFPQNWISGRRHVLSDKVIKTPADLKGLKVRVAPNKVQLETLAAMGGNPTTTAWGETYTALSQGVVDAAEAPLPDLYNSKLHEVRKKVALTGHIMLMNGPITSQKFFESLPDEHKKLLEEATKKYGDIYSEQIAKDENTLWRKSLEDKGVVINETDVDAFAKAAEVVATKFTWSAGTIDKIRAAVK